MAVERKAYWLRHLILIIIVIIVLFPIAWLVNTSIRRDEAAFSPNLFSSRITFQHYKNLLFPQSSVGRLVIDIQSAVYQTGDYSDKSEEEITETVRNYIDKYDELTEKSVKISESINSELENLRKAIDNNIYPNMIESINKIREKDIEFLNEKIPQLGIDTNSPYFIAAVGKILLSYDNWNTDTFKYLLSEFGSVGEEIFNKIGNFDNSLNKLKENETKLFEKVSKIEFHEKNDVLKSLSNTSLYYDPFDYTEWRKIEWLKILNKFLKDIDDEELQVIKSDFYDSFKEARDNFEIVSQSIEELNMEVQKLIENSYTDRTKNYLDAVVSLEDINSSLENLYKSLNSDREAKKEIIDGLSVADPVIAPETEKLEILKNTTEKSLAKNYPVLDSTVEPDEIFNSIQNQNYSINSMLQNINALEITETISILSELEKIRDLYEWFLENAGNITSIAENSDIKNTLKILDASCSNLSRILPSFENTIDDLVTIESKIENYLIDIERLEKQKADYEKTIEENEYYALNEIDNLSKAEELVNIMVVKNIAKNEFSDSVTVNNYIKEISPLIEAFTEEKPKKRYNDYYWYSNAEEAYVNGTEGSVILKSTIDNMNTYMSSLKENVYNYIKLKFLKSPVSIDEFTELQNEFNTGYQLFNAKYQRASRLISDMLDFSPSYSTGISGSLKSMDKNLFDVVQIWKTKQRTYFFFTRWLLNSVIVALSVAIISVLTAALAAYPFSRLRFSGRRQGLLVLLLIQMFPSVMFMIAIYALLQFLGMYIPSLGLNSLGGLIFAYSGGIAFNIYLIKGYYDTIPNSLEESAMIDGCTRFQAFIKVVAPLARPILAVVAILTFMNIFNEFVMARVFLQDITKWTYAVGLWQFSGEFQTEWGPFCSAALIGAIPMVLFFLILQDYIVGGLTQGSVKG